jgi:hypothetical protein
MVALPLGTVAAHQAEVATNALKVGPAGLVIARVVGEEHRQQAGKISPRSPAGPHRQPEAPGGGAEGT